MPYSRIGMMRPLAGTTRFYLTLGNRSVYINQEDAELMLDRDTKIRVYQEYIGEPHSVGWMFLHFNGEQVVVRYENRDYFMYYNQFVCCLHGGLKSANIAEKIYVHTALPWQAVPV